VNISEDLKETLQELLKRNILEQVPYERYKLEPEDETFYEIPLCGYGELNKTITVQRANYIYFKEKYGELDGVEPVRVAYYDGICVTEKCLLSHPDMLEELAGLAGYPVLDDDTLSTLENNLKHEWFEHNARYPSNEVQDFLQAFGVVADRAENGHVQNTFLQTLLNHGDGGEFIFKSPFYASLRIDDLLRYAKEESILEALQGANKIQEAVN
jgi:hypothetical protein